MKCEICKKNQASFYRFVPALARQVPICAACISKVLIVRPEILNLFDETPDTGQEEENYKVGKAVCLNCGFEFDDYYKTGRFGCVKCYDVFHDKITEIVRGIHGCVRHNGSRPVIEGLPK